MKKILTLILLCGTCLTKAQNPSRELLNMITLNGLTDEVKKTYGTVSEPIPSGAFMDIKDKNMIRAKMARMMNSYRWPDGNKLDFSKRASVKSQDKSGILDCYYIPKPGTTDTIRLYVDPYKDADQHFVPEGLVAFSLADLANEIEPPLAAIEAMEKSDDAFVMKKQAESLLQYIAARFSLSNFLDKEILQPIAAEKEVHQDVRSFLVSTYILNKFYAYAKDIPNVRQYAFGKVKENFAEFTKGHPEMDTRNLAAALK